MVARVYGRWRTLRSPIADNLARKVEAGRGGVQAISFLGFEENIVGTVHNDHTQIVTQVNPGHYVKVAQNLLIQQPASNEVRFLKG
ncbi:MAG TPA: hypothetical protein VGF95_10075 [Solirubrobacteraceae bacterium]|jgi:hypothetical protein